MASVARCGSQNQGALKITVSSHRQKMHHLWLGPRSSHVAKTNKCVHVKFQHIHRARDPKSWHISQSIKINLFTNLSYNTSPCPSKKKTALQTPNLRIRLCQTQECQIQAWQVLETWNLRISSSWNALSFHLPLVEVEETPAIGVFVHPLFRRIFGDVLRPIENYRIFLGGTYQFK